MTDLSKVRSDSRFPGFVNNNPPQTGTLTISGTTAAGTNTQTFTVPLISTPDLVQISFNGPTAFGGATDPRSSDGWFQRGAVWVRGDNAGAGYTNYPTNWIITSSINGNTLTIKATFTAEFSASLTLTSTNFSYRLVDYSVF